MKILALMMMAVLLLSVITPMVLAEETADEPEGADTGGSEQSVIAPTQADAEEAETSDAGVTPDSTLYGLDRAMENLRLALIFDKAKRAEVALQHAEERLAEVKAMIEAKKLDQAERAEKYHKEKLEKVQKIIEKIKSDGDENEAKGAIEKVARIKQKIENHQAKVAAVKMRILARQREKMTAEQIAHLEQIFDRIIAKAEKVDASLEQRQEAIKTKYKVLSGKTDKQVEEEFEVEENAESGQEGETGAESGEAGGAEEVAESSETEAGQGNSQNSAE